MRRTMKTREGLARGMRMGYAAEGCPGDCVLVKIDTRRNFVDLVYPFAECDCGFSQPGCEQAWHRCTVGVQMREKAVLLKQAPAIAHRTVMAFDEDAGVGCGYDACCRERTRADENDAGRLTKRGKLSEERV